VNDRRLLLAAAFLRSAAIGMMGPLAGVHLAALGFDDATIGAVLSAGLAGAAVATAWVTLFGHALPRRAALLTVTAATVAGCAVVSLASGPLVVGVAAFVGTLNGMGRDRGACLVVEQAILPETTSDADRTRAFAWYSVMQDAGCALGALFAGLPFVLTRHADFGELPALRTSMLACVALCGLAAVPYFSLSRAAATPPARARVAVSAESRSILARICGLFAIDSVAGGFLTSAFLALFFTRRFGVGMDAVAALFFAKAVLNAVSHFGAAWLAKRIGLVNTMVFTHVPSSLLLVTVTIAPSFVVAAALFLLREGLVEMDVPTRNSYVMAVVRPEERAVASGVTHLVRMAGWAVAPVVAGRLAESAGSIALPLWIGAAMKIVYDLLLWKAFRKLRPPEERTEPAG
jgi:MFS family permease